jgi:hypothetical protein
MSALAASAAASLSGPSSKRAVRGLRAPHLRTMSRPSMAAAMPAKQAAAAALVDLHAKAQVQGHRHRLRCCLKLRLPDANDQGTA